MSFYAYSPLAGELLGKTRRQVEGKGGMRGGLGGELAGKSVWGAV
jgi:hypothetical protein